MPLIRNFSDNGKIETQGGKARRGQSYIVAPRNSGVGYSRLRRYYIEQSALIICKDKALLVTEPEGFAIAPICDVIAMSGAINDYGPKAFTPQLIGQAVDT